MGSESEGKPLNRPEVERIINNELTDEYERLRWTPGFCLDTLSWLRLTELIQLGTVESLGCLGRHPADIAIYWKFRRETLDTYASMEDYVKITKLDFGAITGADRKTRAGEPPAEVNDRPHITFKENDFPYNLEAGVKHHNVWCTRPLSEVELAQVLKDHCDSWEILYWKNPDSLASIPAVWHGHILSRRAGT